MSLCPTQEEDPDPSSAVKQVGVYVNLHIMHVSACMDWHVYVWLCIYMQASAYSSHTLSLQSCLVGLVTSLIHSMNKHVLSTYKVTDPVRR